MPFALGADGTMNIPNSANAHIHRRLGCDKRSRAAEVREVVDTLTVNVVAVVAVKFSVEGTEHVAPVGAPVQLKLAAPLNPAPPIESV